MTSTGSINAHSAALAEALTNADSCQRRVRTSIYNWTQIRLCAVARTRCTNSNAIQEDTKMIHGHSVESLNVQFRAEAFNLLNQVAQWDSLKSAIRQHQQSVECGTNDSIWIEIALLTYGSWACQKYVHSADTIRCRWRVLRDRTPAAPVALRPSQSRQSRKGHPRRNADPANPHQGISDRRLRPHEIGVGQPSSPETSRTPEPVGPRADTTGNLLAPRPRL